MTPEPIAALLARLTAANPTYHLHLLAAPDDAPGWAPATDLTRQASPRLAELLHRAAGHYPSPNRHTAAALWFCDYAFALAATPFACYLAARRVPSLDLAGLHSRFAADGDVEALAWGAPTFAALPTDEAAADPAAIVVPDDAALIAYLRAELVTHFTPLIDAVHRQSTLGRPGLWALAADYCAVAAAWVGEAITGQSEAALAAARTLAAPPGPLHRRRDFLCIEKCGLAYTMVDRTACCLYYQVTDGGQYCSSCPHRPQPERIQLIEAWLAKRAQAATEATAAA